MTQHTASTAQPIPPALIALARQRLARLARHEDYLRLLSLAAMLTRPWREVGYLPVPRDHDRHGLPVNEEFVILAHRDGGDDYIAFHACTPHYRGDYDHVAESGRPAAALADADHAWRSGVQGTLAQVLGWARRHDDEGMHGIEATLALHDVRVCALPVGLYQPTLAGLCRAIKGNVRSRLAEVATWTESIVLVPDCTGVPVSVVTDAAHAHLQDWCDDIAVEEFLPGTEEEWEARALSEAIRFVEDTFPGWVLPVADGGDVI